MGNLVSPNHSSLSTSTPVYFPVKISKASSMPHTRATLMAFVDAVIPSTLGALDLRLDDYVIWALDHYISTQGEWGVKTIPLSTPTAEILDAAAIQLILSGDLKAPLNFSTYPDGGPFTALAPDDRFEAIHLLENGQVDMESLPSPYRNNIGLIKNIVTNLHQMVMIGYYSEWFAFGATRLATPEDRNFKRALMTWDFVNYPGPSMGYREFRGFLVDKFSD